MRTTDIISIDNPKSPIAEAYRTLRTNIQFSGFDKALKVIAITSSNTSEGKTTTLCNLAVSMAQTGNKVLLIDCDLRKSTIHKRFGLSNAQGLTNVLAQHMSLDDVIKQTTIIGLDVLTSGPKPPNPSELLGSNAMKEFLDEVAQKYDRVLIDAPPVGIVTDAAILSTIVDGTILVVEAGKTPIEAVQMSKELLEKVKANIIGIVLNKVPTEGSRYYRYYYYNHYYEEDTGHEKSMKRRKRRHD